MTTTTTDEAVGDEWRTPPDLFAALDRELHFDLDVAATADNALAPWFFVGPCDGRMFGCGCGLCSNWRGHNAFWMNCPYSAPGEWVRTASQAALWIPGEQAPTSGAAILPVAPSRAWWKHCYRTATELRYLERRPQFRLPDGRKKTTAQFDSCLFIWRAGAAQGPAPRTTYWDY